ncbi:MAG: DUF1207 domain-containing protein [Flavobacteriales bacterium]|nr:DUF1207 domain-containing protein [Flavobacteriales bacterium]
MKKLIVLLVVLVAFQLTQAQEKVWLGKRITNTAIFLDPTEVQMFGSITQLTYDQSTKIKNYRKPNQPNATKNITRDVDEATNSRQYIPFNFGGALPIVSKILTDKKAKSWEIFAEVGVTTQFEWRHMDTGGIKRNNLNSDYRINLNYVRAFEKSSYRIRMFHVSSHLGDDFISQQGITFAYPTTMNYEQLDFTYFRDINQKYSYYLGAGSVIRPESIRLPFSYMLGSEANWKNSERKWGWTAGINIKGHQTTDFYPNVKIAAGPAFFSSFKDEPFRIVFEYYNGHIPYSQYEVEKVSWFGAGIYFYI